MPHLAASASVESLWRHFEATQKKTPLNSKIIYTCSKSLVPKHGRGKTLSMLRQAKLNHFNILYRNLYHWWNYSGINSYTACDVQGSLQIMATILGCLNLHPCHPSRSCCPSPSCFGVSNDQTLPWCRRDAFAFRSVGLFACLVFLAHCLDAG